MAFLTALLANLVQARQKARLPCADAGKCDAGKKLPLIPAANGGVPYLSGLTKPVRFQESHLSWEGYLSSH